jgi:hypothetical protein
VGLSESIVVDIALENVNIKGEEGIPDWLCGGDDGWVCGEHYGWEQAGLVWAEVSIKEKGKK